MRAGSVGITLTAAATPFAPRAPPTPRPGPGRGRIHRLGQSSDVLIKKFVVNGTVEASICELHDDQAEASRQHVARAATPSLRAQSFKGERVLKERASLLRRRRPVEALLFVEAPQTPPDQDPGGARNEAGRAAMRRSREERERAELALGLLVAAVADEIRTPDAAAAVMAKSVMASMSSPHRTRRGGGGGTASVGRDTGSSSSRRSMGGR
ncbi:helicase [Aureococcus anophagefferens]|nr:helicase [Aureococcus anophagefferens]